MDCIYTMSGLCDYTEDPNSAQYTIVSTYVMVLWYHQGTQRRKFSKSLLLTQNGFVPVS